MPDCPRVYVVDDEWIIAETLATILSKNGFQSQAFHNPGLALTRALSQPPDILLADVMMPSMTGIEIAVALRGAGHNTRILLFSGQDCSHELLLDARRRGYDFELLEKPIHPLQLLLRLRNSPSRAARREAVEPDEAAYPTPGSQPAA